MHRFQGMVIRFHISWDRSKCVIYSNIYWLRDSLLSSLCMDSVIINSKILYRAGTSICIWKLSIIDLSCVCFFVSMIECGTTPPPPPPHPLRAPHLSSIFTQSLLTTIYKLYPIIVAIELWQVDATDFHTWHLFMGLFHANSSLECITEWHIA